MPIIKLESIVDGDVLAGKVTIMDVDLFDAGTVLTPQRVVILRVLGVQTVSVESRTEADYDTVQEALERIDERFGYVEGKPFMMTIKSWVKDIVREVEIKK